MGPEMTWKWSWGWDLSQSLLLVTLSVLRLVTGLVLTLGDTLGGHLGRLKNSWNLGPHPPTDSDFIGVGFRLGGGTLQSSSGSLKCNHVGNHCSRT